MLPENDPRHSLEMALLRYEARHPENAAAAERILRFIRTAPDCFCRSHVAGHITGSAWLLDPRGGRALLTLHRKLGRWLQPGGHADGEADTLRVALREAEEESGIAGIVPMSREIFDVDVHEIPARPAAGEPAHLHYDIRYLLQAPSAAFCISEESEALAWFLPEELAALQPEESIQRMLRLWQEWLCAGNGPGIMHPTSRG